MPAEINKIVFDAISALNDDIEVPEFETPTLDTEFFSLVDSLSVLNLILDLEERLLNETGQYVQLADEHVMDATNTSLKTIAGIIDHVNAKVVENGQS